MSDANFRTVPIRSARGTAEALRVEVSAAVDVIRAPVDGEPPFTDEQIARALDDEAKRLRRPKPVVRDVSCVDASTRCSLPDAAGEWCVYPRGHLYQPCKGRTASQVPALPPTPDDFRGSDYPDPMPTPRTASHSVLCSDADCGGCASPPSTFGAPEEWTTHYVVGVGPSVCGWIPDRLPSQRKFTAKCDDVTCSACRATTAYLSARSVAAPPADAPATGHDELARLLREAPLNWTKAACRICRGTVVRSDGVDKSTTMPVCGKATDGRHEWTFALAPQRMTWNVPTKAPVAPHSAGAVWQRGRLYAEWLSLDQRRRAGDATVASALDVAAKALDAHDRAHALGAYAGATP